ncbi:MAG: ABC transporter ATP-binding protein/permease [Acidobacteria bacterium]|nr:ABC transporter ATP-binding protein/permease [Acidobacteriota bacterium]
MTEQRGSDEVSSSALRGLRPYFRQVSGLLFLGSVAGIVMNVAIVLPAILLGRALNVVVAYHEGKATGRAVAVAAFLVVLGTAATEVPRIGKRWWLGVARTRLQAALRADAFRGVLAWTPSRAMATPVGEIMARVVGDVDVLGEGVSEVIVETWDTVLFSISLVVAMMTYDARLTMVALLPVPVALWIAGTAGRRIAARTIGARQSDAHLTSLVHDLVSSHRVLRLTGRRAAAVARVEGLARRQAVAEVAALRFNALLLALYSSLLSLGVVFVIGRGGEQVAAGQLSVGALVALLALFVRFIGRAPRIPQMANRIQAARAAYHRLESLLPPPREVATRRRSRRGKGEGARSDEGPVRMTREPGPARLRFEGVTFAYPAASTPVVEDFHLDVAAGSLVAITGAVGSGKTTLAKLAVGLLPPDRGDILLNGHSLAYVDPDSRAQWVSYVGQEVTLFSGSIRDNLTLDFSETGETPSTRNLEMALALSALDGDVASMPRGLDTLVGERGVRLSGGQRQRLSLARSLVANGFPKLLVLDDPFSSLDVETEARVVAQLRHALLDDADLARRATILLFSHRLASFPRADQVVVLHEGRVVESGTHADLLESGGLYARIFYAQARLSSTQ